MPDAKTHLEARRRRATLVACCVVFLLALGVRALHWQDNRHYFLPFAGMSGEYKAHAMTLVAGDLRFFLRGADPPSNADFVKHPPGYPLLMAGVYSLFGDRDEVMRFVHIALDALACVFTLLIAAELLPFGAALAAGLLTALSPQLAYHSFALVPDPLAGLPILVAFYLLARAGRRPSLARLAAAGALVGVSCWLRSNALMLPFFMAALAPIMFERGQRLRAAAVTVCAALAVLLPVTVRNAVVWRAFIPVSLSAGITLVEGIGSADTEGRFGLPSSDYGVTKWEAERDGRPDYLGTRFTPDGVERERKRVAAGLAVVRQDPVWFLGVMARRAASMPRLARVEIIDAAPAATRPLYTAEGAQPAHTIPAAALTSVHAARPRLDFTPAGDDASLLYFAGDQAGALLLSPALSVEPDTDYMLRVPLRIKEGSLVVEVLDTRDGSLLSVTQVVHPIRYLDYTEETQPFVTVERPFTSGGAREVRFVLRNGARGASRVVAAAGAAELHRLGPSSLTWMRYPRAVLRAAQKLFLTAVMLPLALVGVFALARRREWGALALLLVVPAYYMCVQSALWTEFRYVMTMHYFLFILSGAGLHLAASWLLGAARRLTPRAGRG